MSEPNKAKELTLDDQVYKIRDAISSKLNPGMDTNTGMVGGDEHYWISELYDSHAIVCKGEVYYDVSYSFTVDGLELGDMVEVERDWRPVGAKLLGAFKRGARNSRKDQQRIQGIHDYATENGAVCAEKKDFDLPDGDDAVIQYGEMVKATRTDAGVKVGGYLIRFTNENDLDLTGDFFAADTDYDTELPASKTTYFHHGMDAKVGKRKLGHADLHQDEFGIWADTILQERDEYERFIAELALAGKLGWSSGTAGHLMDRRRVGNANKITRWPIVEASLTHTPAEPRNSVMPMKSLITVTGTGEQPVVADTKHEPIVEPKLSEDKMDEEMKALLAQVATDAATKAVEEYKRAEPASDKAGVNIEVGLDEADQPWEHAGQFFKAVKTATFRPAAEDPRLRSVKVTGMSEGVPADGEYLLPKPVAEGILENMFAVGKILSRLPIDPVAGNSMTYNGVDETSRIAGSRRGGVRGYWLAEGSTITSSKPKFRQFELKLKKVGALCYATDEQLEDTVNLESWLGRVVPEELIFMAEDAIFEGDGVGKPLGIMAAPARVDVLRVDASTITFADLSKMWARRMAWLNDYVWFVNQDTNPQLDSLILASSTEIPTRFVQYGPEGVLTIKGRPVVEVEYASTLGTVGDIVLASMSQYQAISKGGVKSASSIHVQFATDEMAFRFIYRIDGAPNLASPVTPFKGSNTVSPFVALTTST